MDLKGKKVLITLNKEFVRIPKVLFSKMISEPRMFFKKFKGCVAFKWSESFANTNNGEKANKDEDIVNNNRKFINFESFSISKLSQKELAIHPETIEFEGAFSIFNFPSKTESILSKAMFSGFQIHFSSLKPTYANLNIYFKKPNIQILPNSKTKELNFYGGTISPCVKARVSPLLM